MENTPGAAAEAPKAPETVATPTNNEPAQAPAQPANSVDLHGFTDEDLAGMRTFIDNNGGWEKIKSRISNPTPQPQPVQPQTSEPASQLQPQQVEQPQYRAPEGSITAQEFLAQQYFQSLSKDPKYEAISEQIANGDVLKEMASFNIQPLNQDGSLNDQMVRRYLDLKAQTVPAKSTSTEPSASPAPTVEYIPTGEDGKVTTADQAYAILQQDAQLKAMGQAGHPAIAQAEEFIKNQLNPSAKK